MTTNESIMNLELSRLNVCDILLALTHLTIDFKNEIDDANTSETRREIAKSSLKRWQKLHDEVKRQLKEFDGDME